MTGAEIVRIRPFEPRDQAAARRVVLEGLGGHFGFIDESRNPDLDGIGGYYIEAGHAFLVAERNGELVGTTGLLFERPGRARVVRMSVLAGHRRSGVARALLAAAIELARSRGIDVVEARTQPEWPDAVGFYRSAGFEYFDEDDEDVYLQRSITEVG